MKRFISLLAVVCLAVGAALGIGVNTPVQAADRSSQFTATVAPVLAEEVRNAAEDKLSNPFGETLDVNNANVRAFLEFPGMYPTIAGKVVQNAPYDSVEDVLEIPGLSDREKEIIQMHIDRLVVTDPETALVEGGDRYNNGIYR